MEEYVEYDCTENCGEPICLRTMDINEKEAFRPFFNKVMQDISVEYNFEQLYPNLMEPDDYEMLMHFSCSDMFEAMYRVAKLFKDESK